MKKVCLYSIFLILSSTHLSWSQGNGKGSSITLNFPDSVLIVLENTRTVDATVVGSGFASLWSNLSLDQQQVIRKQTVQELILAKREL